MSRRNNNRKNNFKKIEDSVDKATGNGEDSAIPEPQIKPTNGFNYFSVYNWLDATDSFLKSDNFTNYSKNSGEFSKNIYELIQTFIPCLYKEWKKIFDTGNNWQFRHCHQVEDKHKDLVNRIAEEINHTAFPNFDGEDYCWWQLGFSGATRVYGVYIKAEHAFYPIFCDWHHLINGDEKHNTKDYQHYSYNPKD